MNPHYFDSSTKAGTVGGTLLSILANINTAQIFLKQEFLQLLER